MVPEGVVRVFGQKDTVVLRRVHLFQINPVAWLQVRIAGSTRPAGTAALEKHHQLVTGAGTHEKPVGTAVGTDRVTLRFNDIPARG